MSPIGELPNSLQPITVCWPDLFPSPPSRGPCSLGAHLINQPADPGPRPSSESTSLSSVLLEHSPGHPHVLIVSPLFTCIDVQGLQSHLNRTSLLTLPPVTSRNHRPCKCPSGRHPLKSHHSEAARRESMPLLH